MGFASGWWVTFGAPSLPPAQSNDWWVPVALGCLVCAWRPRAGAAVALGAPVGAFWLKLIRSPWAGLGWGVAMAATMVATGALLDRIRGRTAAAVLVGVTGVDALALVATGSARLAFCALLLLAAALPSLLWGRLSTWPWAVLHGLLIWSGVHWSSLGVWAVLPALAPALVWVPARWGSRRGVPAVVLALLLLTAVFAWELLRDPPF
jgi:hypothetical protein